MELATGLEPAPDGLQNRYATHCATPACELNRYSGRAYHGARNRTRTCNRRFTEPLLCQLSYASILVAEAGLEPANPGV